MPEEEIFKDLKREGITIKEEDIMWPEPSPEQMTLWGNIEKNIAEKVLERENLFKALPKTVKSLLASESASNKLVKIGQKHKLAKEQSMALARYVKSLFITLPKEEELEVSKLINLLRSDLDINPERAQALFQDVNNEILLPALKDVLAESIPGESAQSKNENIVDLKNLPRE